MPTIEVGLLTFEFPKGWPASLFDEWSYYRNQFQNLGNNVRVACSGCSAELRCKSCGTNKNAGIKASDIVAVANANTWLIEVKDYRHHQRTKAIGLADEIALKVRDSLAVLVAASVNANDPDQKAFAQHAAKCSRMRVVLHLEQPINPSKLFPRALKPADVLQRLRQLLKSVDPHPLVVEINDMHGLAWSVS